VSLELLRDMSYDAVTGALADALGLEDETRLRLTPYNCYTQSPKPHPLKWRSVDSLGDMLTHYNQTADTIYYEILDIPLPEFERLKTLKVGGLGALRGCDA
jgi:ubiquitin carboxyl-terminal hydrolase 7